jgi:hypothetical protein
VPVPRRKDCKGYRPLPHRGCTDYRLPPRRGYKDCTDYRLPPHRGCRDCKGCRPPLRRDCRGYRPPPHKGCKDCKPPRFLSGAQTTRCRLRPPLHRDCMDYRGCTDYKPPHKGYRGYMQQHRDCRDYTGYRLPPRRGYKDCKGWPPHKGCTGCRDCMDWPPHRDCRRHRPASRPAGPRPRYHRPPRRP